LIINDNLNLGALIEVLERDRQVNVDGRALLLLLLAAAAKVEEI
jgi:hypothetical protein